MTTIKRTEYELHYSLDDGAWVTLGYRDGESRVRWEKRTEFWAAAGKAWLCEKRLDDFVEVPAGTDVLVGVLTCEYTANAYRLEYRDDAMVLVGEAREPVHADVSFARRVREHHNKNGCCYGWIEIQAAKAERGLEREKQKAAAEKKEAKA